MPASCHVFRRSGRQGVRLTGRRRLPKVKMNGLCPPREFCWGVPSPNPAKRESRWIPSLALPISKSAGMRMTTWRRGTGSS